MANPARQLILDIAENAPPLWELTSRLALAGSSTVREVRAALGVLLREGHVLLYDAAHPVAPISLRDALGRIADDRSWVRGGLPAYIVILTESGGAEYRSASAA